MSIRGTVYSEDRIRKNLHKRSRSDLVLSQHPPIHTKKELRLVTEESSSGVSESELIIRRIIAENSESKPADSAVDSTDLALGLQVVQRDMETQKLKIAGRRKTIRQQVLHLVNGRRSRSEEWSMSPEPRAQAVPVFKPVRRDNRGAVSAAVEKIRRGEERMELRKALKEFREVEFFIVVFESREVVEVRGVYGWQGEEWRRVWGKIDAKLEEQRVDTCYRYSAVLGFRLLPHRRVSKAIDGVVLLQPL